MSDRGSQRNGEIPEATATGRVAAVYSFRLHLVPGFSEPEELQLEIGRRGELRAYWNGQAWVG